MKVTTTDLPDVLLLEPNAFSDARGFFMETYNKRVFRDATGVDFDFVQDNHTRSARNVLRGLHYQIRHAQGKLVRVAAGEIFDVVVDLRKRSPTFGRHAAFSLSSESRRMAWIPPGYAHGFLALSDGAEVLYKTTNYWFPEFERTIAWNDPDLGITWPVANEPQLSAKDKLGLRLKDAEVFD
jgi:dTDP-4-dehydrorhamnose 3,5-epimerase